MRICPVPAEVTLFDKFADREVRFSGPALAFAGQHLATEVRSFCRRVFCIRRPLTLRNPTSRGGGVNGRVGWRAVLRGDALE